MWPVFLFFLSFSGANEILLTFQNDSVKVRSEESVPLSVTLNAPAALRNLPFLLEFSCQNGKVCSFDNVTHRVDFEGSSENLTLPLTLVGIFIGETEPVAQIKGLNATVRVEGDLTKIVVLRTIGGKTLSTTFTAVLTVLIVINTFVMGTQLDLKIIMKVVKRPVGPAIGFCCQYILMPLLGFLYATLLLEVPSYQFGFFIVGCSPGGGLSNFWTILLEGNLDLSVTMTFFSNLAALGMLPLWVFTLGRQFYGGAVNIPFFEVAKALMTLLVPATLGMLLIHFKPHLAAKFEKVLKLITFIVILIAVPFGLYANLYVFKLVTWKIIICGFLLPWSGYIISYLAAFLLRQPHRDNRTIAVETGIQNTMIAMLVCRFSLPEPDSDLTIVVPICVFLLTTLPLWVFLAALKCYNKREEKKSQLYTVEMEDITNTEEEQKLTIN